MNQILAAFLAILVFQFSAHAADKIRGRSSGTQRPICSSRFSRKERLFSRGWTSGRGHSGGARNFSERGRGSLAFKEVQKELGIKEK
jgi:hypothetical protein